MKGLLGARPDEVEALRPLADAMERVRTSVRRTELEETDRAAMDARVAGIRATDEPHASPRLPRKDGAGGVPRAVDAPERSRMLLVMLRECKNA